MDVNRFFNYGGDYVKNPNYKKGNGQPKYITSVDANPKVVSGVLTNTADLPTVFNPDKTSDRLARGMLEHNLPLRREDYINNNFNNILAESQSGIEQARNSLIQTISEATLGTAKAFADLFDLVTLAQMRKDSDYQNPVSTQLEEWQKQIREDVAPIYQDPNVNISNGGLFDSGFIFNGLPSIISSLTLLIPSKAVSYGLTRGASWITRKGLTFARNIERAHKAAQLGDAAEGASRVAKVNAYINGPASQTAKNIIDYGIGGLTSRLLENYQEGRQTFDESKPVYTQILNNMSLADRNNTVNKLKEEFGEERVHDIVQAVFNREKYVLTKELNPIVAEKLVFNFTNCEGTIEECVSALASIEKVFRLYKPYSASAKDWVEVDVAIDRFLKDHFNLYGEYAQQPVNEKGEIIKPKNPNYVYYAYCKEDVQEDDLTMIAVQRP